VGDAVDSQPGQVAFIRQHLAMIENHGHIRYPLMGADGRCPDPTRSADGRLEVHAGDLRIGVPDSLDYDGVTPINGLAWATAAPIPGPPCGGPISR
jgi:hypothetical protein